MGVVCSTICHSASNNSIEHPQHPTPNTQRRRRERRRRKQYKIRGTRKKIVDDNNNNNNNGVWKFPASQEVITMQERGRRSGQNLRNCETCSSSTLHTATGDKRNNPNASHRIALLPCLCLALQRRMIFSRNKTKSKQKKTNKLRREIWSLRNKKSPNPS